MADVVWADVSAWYGLLALDWSAAAIAAATLAGVLLGAVLGAFGLAKSSV